MIFVLGHKSEVFECFLSEFMDVWVLFFYELQFFIEILVADFVLLEYTHLASSCKFILKFARFSLESE